MKRGIPQHDDSQGALRMCFENRMSETKVTKVTKVTPGRRGLKRCSYHAVTEEKVRPVRFHVLSTVTLVTLKRPSQVSCRQHAPQSPLL